MADNMNLNQAAAAVEAGEVIAPLVADDPLDQLHQVLDWCGVRAAADCNNIVNHEGFNLIDDPTILEGDSDVIEMVKRMASHMEANGHVNLSTVMIKCLQGLVLLCERPSYAWIDDDCQRLDAGDYGDGHNQDRSEGGIKR